MIVSSNYNIIVKLSALRPDLFGILFFRILTALLSCLFFETVYASDPVAAVNEGITFTSIMNLVAGLVVVLLIFCCLVYLLRRLSGAGAINQGNIKIIDALHLSTRERLVLVKVADVYMLLGVSSGNISALHVATDWIPPEENKSAEAGIGSRFHQLLSASKLKI